MEPSCISPTIPRVLTLESTFFKSPTPLARVCISPNPLYTCSSLSLTKRNDCPMRSSKVFCSFSSTVARICSSLLPLSSCMVRMRCSMVCRICSSCCSVCVVSRATLSSISFRPLSMVRCKVSLRWVICKFSSASRLSCSAEDCAWEAASSSDKFLTELCTVCEVSWRERRSSCCKSRCMRSNEPSDFGCCPALESAMSPMIRLAALSAKSR